MLPDRETCIKAVKQRELEYDGRRFLLPKESSEPYNRAYFSKGRVDNYDGTCHSVSTTLDDGTFVYGIVEETRIKVLARTVAGRWELESGALVVDEHLPGVFRTGELLDAMSGAYYWDEGDVNGACALSLTEVFMGAAALYVPTRASAADRYVGSTLMVDSNNASQSIALVLGEPGAILQGERMLSGQEPARLRRLLPEQVQRRAGAAVPREHRAGEALARRGDLRPHRPGHQGRGRVESGAGVVQE